MSTPVPRLRRSVALQRIGRQWPDPLVARITRCRLGELRSLAAAVHRSQAPFQGTDGAGRPLESLKSKTRCGVAHRSPVLLFKDSICGTTEPDKGTGFPHDL